MMEHAELLELNSRWNEMVSAFNFTREVNLSENLTLEFRFACFPLFVKIRVQRLLNQTSLSDTVYKTSSKSNVSLGVEHVLVRSD